MPADGSFCCPFASNGDVGTSRFEEQFWRRLNNFTHVQNASILAGRRKLGYARSSYPVESDRCAPNCARRDRLSPATCNNLPRLPCLVE